MVQWEIAEALRTLKKFSADFQVTKHRQADRYLDSYEVFSQIAGELKQRGINQIILVAHPVEVIV